MIVGRFLKNAIVSTIKGGRTTLKTNDSSEKNTINTAIIDKGLGIFFDVRNVTAGFNALIKINARKSAYINSLFIQRTWSKIRNITVKTIVFADISIFCGIIVISTYILSPELFQ
jgi:hypothetical protein